MSTPREQLRRPLIDLFMAGRLKGQKPVSPEVWHREIGTATDAILAVIKGLPAMQEEQTKFRVDKDLSLKSRKNVGRHLNAEIRNEVRRKILAELESK